MPKTDGFPPGLDPELLRQAGGLIRQGKLVAFPTETVYGLGANALDPEAVAKIFEVKGRPCTSPLIVHVDSIEMARTLTSAWPAQASVLASSFWPGPLTLILPKQPCVPDLVTAGLPTVGIRVPDHPVALALIREAGVPIAAPSANPFTQLSPTAARHVEESLGGQVDLILDGGPATVGIESTVLSLAVSPPQLLRPGMVTRQQIEAKIGPVEWGARLENGLAHPSPGLHRQHYSPRTPLLLVSGEAPLPPGRGVAVYWSHPLDPGQAAVRMPAEPADYASVLYETLHRLDREGYDWIAVEEPPASPGWAAVADRLRRASSSR